MRKLSPRAVKWLTLQLDIRVRIHWSLIPDLTPVLRATELYHCLLARACPEAKRSDTSEVQGHLVRLESNYYIRMEEEMPGVLSCLSQRGWLRGMGEAQSQIWVCPARHYSPVLSAAFARQSGTCAHKAASSSEPPEELSGLSNCADT